MDANMGFSLYGWQHILWLFFGTVLIVTLCILYRKAEAERRKGMRLILGGLYAALELVVLIDLRIHNDLSVTALPLHLCNISGFLCFFHALKPRKALGNFLYCIGMPGAVFALLFPDWADLPAFSFLSVVWFTCHILIAAYPIVMIAGGDIERDAKELPKCFLILLGIAAVLYVFNRIFDTNYMFLMEPAEGSPLELFEKYLGNPGYILPCILVIALLWTVLYLPCEWKRRRRRKRSDYPKRRNKNGSVGNPSI